MMHLDVGKYSGPLAQLQEQKTNKQTKTRNSEFEYWLCSQDDNGICAHVIVYYSSVLHRRRDMHDMHEFLLEKEVVADNLLLFDDTCSNAKSF